MRGKENLVRCAARCAAWLAPHPIVESLCVLFLLVAMSMATAQTPIPEPSGTPTIIYVDVNANGLNIGSSWAHAINSLQDALLLAYFYEKPVEIRVAQGIYTPDRGIGIMPGDRTASFQLINGVTVKGGYAVLNRRGGGPDIRDINQYKSILSGNLNADDSPVSANYGDNSCHVVRASGTDATAVLDGLTITGGGYAEGPLPYGGGGMYNDRSNPALINCTFTGNAAVESGGGMYNNSSNPVLLNCTFSGNTAPRSGGGMYNSESNPTLTNCTFVDNRGGDSGGGMYNINSNPMLADCMFSGNTTTGSGGGMFNDSSAPTLLNCIFNGNSAQISGGGMYNRYTSQPSLTNCIFSGNSAGSGGGMESLDDSHTTLLNCTFSTNVATAGGGAISSIQDSITKLVNCILWADMPDEIWIVRSERGRISTSGAVEITYSNVQNGWPSEGNIDIEPLFADPENGDYHLKSQAGRWDPISQSWVIDQQSSPCIDAGDLGMPVGLERFPNGERINMGAYGGTAEASLSPQQQPNLFSKATDPDPAKEAENVLRDVTLRWTAGINAVWHNVYFGPSINDMLLVSMYQTATKFELEMLEYGTTYYWRIDEVDSDGSITTGGVWTFTTTTPPQRR